MLARASLRSRLSSYGCSACLQNRSYAAASGSLNFQPSEASGLKIVSRDTSGPSSTLALVAKAGSRYEWLPGLSEGLSQFAFKNTEKRFAVRIVRESELLGSELFTYRTREAVVYGAKFLKDDLPFFAELLAEVATLNKYQRKSHVLHEIITPVREEAQSKFLADASAVAAQAAHSLAFHRGLGAPLFSTLSKPFHLHAEEVEAYGSAAYAKPNIALVGSGISSSDLSKWTGEFFGDLSSAAPQGLPSLSGSPAKYFGGEERISSSKGNSIVIGFSGSSLANVSAYKPEIDAIGSLLGGTAPVKWGSGTSLLAKAASSHGVSISTNSAKYSDAGLLYVTISGGAKEVAAAAKDVAATLKSLSSGSVPKEAIQKAVAQAKFKAADIESGEAPNLDLLGLSAINGKVLTPEEAIKGLGSVSEAAVSQAAKKLLDGKATVATVGDLSILPFAEELGLNV